MAKHSLYAPLLLAILCLLPNQVIAERFRLATYNLENYIDTPEGNRRIKPPEAKAKILESILAMKPDVLAMEEMGSTNTLLDLQASLRAANLDLPYWEHITGADTNVHLAVLSRYAFTARQPHTNETFVLSGRRFHVSRGFIELEITVNAHYKFTLITTHLKSRNPSPMADEAEQREQEAGLLHELVTTRLAADPSLNLAVVGDFNDIRDSKPLRLLLGRGKTGLFDTRPQERNPCPSPTPPSPTDLRTVAWTYYYGKEDTYSRFDYILLSPGMKKEWVREETFIPVIPNWGMGSDHRPIVATFEAEDR